MNCKNLLIIFVVFFCMAVIGGSILLVVARLVI